MRYYFAAKLSNHIGDIDLNFTDFIQRVNADLVGKVVNIASRCAAFINKQFSDQLSTQCVKTELYQKFVTAGETIAQCYENREYSQAVRRIMALADQVNQYIDEEKPWILIKQKKQQAQEVCSLGINLFRILMIYLSPILPETTIKAQAFLNVDTMAWNSRQQPLLNHRINPFKPLLARIATFPALCLR